MGQRQSFSGIAPKTTLTAPAGLTDTVLSVAATTGYPDTANGPFVITLDRGVAGSEERCLCSSYTSSSMTVTRHYDGTSAAVHAANSGTVEHTIDAAWHQDVSAQLYAVSKGDLFYASAASTPGKLTIGSTGQFLRVSSGLPAWSGLVLADIGALYTAAGQFLVGTGVGTAALQGGELAMVVTAASASDAVNSSVITTGTCTRTLPVAPADGTIEEYMNTSGTLTIARGGSSTINHYGTGSLTSLVIPAGMSVKLRYKSSSAIWYVVQGGFIPGVKLKSTQYNPGGSATYPTSSGTLAAVDNTNLPVTFIAPPNGIVEFSWAAFAQPATGGGAMYGSGWDVNAAGSVGPAELLIYNANAADTGTRVRYSATITGLTPGNSYTFAPGFSETGGTAFIGYGTGSPFYGSVLVEVRAAV